MMAGFDEFMTKNANNTETDLKERKRVYHYHYSKEFNEEETKQDNNNSSDIGIKADDDIFVIMSCLLNRLKKNSILYWNKFSQYPPQIKLSFAIIIILLSIYFMIPTSQPSYFIKKFADSTNDIFSEINTIDLPASDAIMAHTVSCRRAANMIERSPAFKNNGKMIASNLRLFGEKVMIAGQDLRKMYRKGSFVFTAFDIEIDAMMKKLEKLEYGDIKYFSNRLNKLADIIKEFRIMVADTIKSVTDAENTRDGTEKYIIEGIREAENFIVDFKSNSVEITKSKVDLQITNDIMKHLHNAALHLDKVNKILIDYEDKLYDLSTEMSQITTGGYDDILNLSKTDLKYLKNSVDILKKTHDKFVRKENLIEG
ncbi:unnamed protein product [Rhizophagus irregularis]|uniref:Uncharacterized protein n=2 Tax=Rhizophagus irregularis TaxID=588596 RepID=A0A2I1E6P5_9GLOM|nr:hypothetical protein RhiirB3_404748 [Rhizophagus irregularis]CAB5122527.1 unnamed protein product [Rhizophagus irregularis]CAB5372623.1 unnamed protein product [Rhizophagus irregularis]